MYSKGGYMMRILTALVLMSFTIGMAQADNLFQSNNPFAYETNSPNLNNIYETTPKVMEQEKQTAKKVRKNRWWGSNDEINTELKEFNEGIPTPKHQRAEDSGFVIFK